MMKRELTATLGGEDITLAATFAAAQEISEKVTDPLVIAREAALEDMLGRVGQIHNPRWTFTVTNVPMILHIGMKAAGDKRTLAQVQEIVFDAGFLESKTVALEYLTIIVTPKSEEITEKGDAPEKE